MITVTSVEAQNRFGQLLDTVQREPVVITRHGRMAFCWPLCCFISEYSILATSAL